MTIKNGHVRRSTFVSCISFISLCIVSGIASAFDEPKEYTFQEAVKEGDLSIDMRLRYEDRSLSMASADMGAQALTWRTNLRYETQTYKLFSAAIGLQHNAAIPDDSSYNSGTNNQNDDAAIADPESTDVNEAWLAYDILNTLFKYGRQPIAWDNSRFIGSEPWRQLGQSYLGLSVRNEFLNYTRIRFAQLHHQKNVLGHDDSSDQDLDATLFNVEYRGFLNSLLSIYAYDIDNDSGNDSWDTSTFGLRFSSEIVNEPTIEYALEYAKQSDKADNKADYSASYYLIEGGITWQGVRVFGGREVLGADGTGFFVTPLGNKHEFQGFSDQFENAGLGNIAGGVSDRYYSLGYHFTDEAAAFATWHEFDSDDDSVGPGNLGKEFDLEVRFERDAYRLSFKYSDYDAQNFSVDTKTYWLTAELVY